jgi:hypothetical protein
MKQFLLVYRRSSGTLMECRELGNDPAVALQERVAAERNQSDSDVEVVLLSAPSFEALKRTHSRYFSDRQGLTDRLNSAVSS